MYTDTILNYFKELSRIPRQSGNEAEVRTWLQQWVDTRSYEWKQDKTGNLVIYVPATNGYEQKETIILQAHMDMVCVKDQISNHDFANDPIDVYTDGDRLKARGTTLGADNGIGLALCMLAVDFEDHPPLELLFTVDEEVGLGGAINLDGSLLQGSYLINLDTEEEGEICISSAGSARALVDIPFKKSKGQLEQYTFVLEGMQGGHSGVEIHKNRGNAIYERFACIDAYPGEIELVSIVGGVASNAIPPSCRGIIGIDNIKTFTKHVDEWSENMKTKYDCPNISWKLEVCTEQLSIVQDSKNLISLILKQKVGVYTMSELIPGLVQTSNSLGIIVTKRDMIQVTYMLRSSDSTELDDNIEGLMGLFKNTGYKILINNKSPGRQEDKESRLVQITKECYQHILGKEPKIVAVHAGLECGAIVNKIGTQAVSFGPTIKNAHSPQEMCYLPSIKTVAQVLEQLLAKI